MSGLDCLKREVLDGMTTFSTREESDALIITFDSAAGLNDFRNNALRDSLYELVQSQSRAASGHRSRSRSTIFPARASPS